MTTNGPKICFVSQLFHIVFLKGCWFCTSKSDFLQNTILLGISATESYTNWHSTDESVSGKTCSLVPLADVLLAKLGWFMYWYSSNLFSLHLSQLPSSTPTMFWESTMVNCKSKSTTVEDLNKAPWKECYSLGNLE